MALAMSRAVAISAASAAPARHFRHAGSVRRVQEASAHEASPDRGPQSSAALAVSAAVLSFRAAAGRRRTCCRQQKSSTTSEMVQGPVVKRLLLEKQASPPFSGRVRVDVSSPIGKEDFRMIAVVALCFLITSICALDRAAMSVAVIPMSQEFHYTNSDKGVVASAYFWGYTVSNLFSGILCTLVSPKQVLTVGVILWSLFTVLTPVAASSSLPLLLGCRALMGVAEGTCLPTIQQMLANWVPKAERSRALALTTSGITAGTVGALVWAPKLVAAYAWPSVFFIFGSLGLIWCALWVPLAEDKPVSSVDSRPIRSGSESTADGSVEFWKSWAAIPWSQLFESTPFRGVLVCGIAHNIGQLLLLSWLPVYFANTFDKGVADASMLAIPPWVACFVVGNIAGWASDALLAAGTGIREVRRGFQLIGSLGPAACLLRLATAPSSESEAVVLFTVALGLSACSYVGFNAAPQDMSRRYASVVYGVLNATGCFAASLAVWLTGVALEVGPDGSPGAGFSSVFMAAAGTYVLGAAAFASTYQGFE